MPTGLPKHFDPERLAARGDALSGETDTAGMPRLGEMLATKDVRPVAYEVRAFRDEARRLVLEGTAHAVLDCTCQRCMEPVALAVDADFALAIVADEDAARNLPAELDPLIPLNASDVDLAAVLEDELILALPPIPVHATESECGERVQYGRREGNDEDEFDGSAKKENPFAVLKKLKNGNTDRGN